MRSLRRTLSPRLIVHSALAASFPAVMLVITAPIAIPGPWPVAAQTEDEKATSTVSDAWSEPARELAAKIASHLGSRAAVVTVKNVSSLTRDDAAKIRRVLREELKRKGVRIVAARPEPRQAAADARGAITEPESVGVTLSENAEGYLWVAEIRSAAETAEVVMSAVPRPAETGDAPAPASLVIRRARLWEDDQPILDVAAIDASSLVVLDAANVSLVRLGSATAAGSVPPPEVVSAPLAHFRPWPRDLRGRIKLEPAPESPSGTAVPPAQSFVAYLPGVECHGTLEPGLTVKCSDVDDAWPAELHGERSRFAAGRNFFEGRLVAAENAEARVPPYFSVAELPFPAGPAGPAGGLEIFDGVDGRVRLRTNGRTAATWAGWGSNIAAIKADCARRWLVLADSPSESTEPDTVRAYEIDRDAAAAASPAVEFAGPMTALWSENDGSSVLAVSRNLRTEKYEAYSLSISCGQ